MIDAQGRVPEHVCGAPGHHHLQRFCSTPTEGAELRGIVRRRPAVDEHRSLADLENPDLGDRFTQLLLYELSRLGNGHRISRPQGRQGQGQNETRAGSAVSEKRGVVQHAGSLGWQNAWDQIRG